MFPAPFPDSVSVPLCALVTVPACRTSFCHCMRRHAPGGPRGQWVRHCGSQQPGAGHGGIAATDRAAPGMPRAGGSVLARYQDGVWCGHVCHRRMVQGLRREGLVCVACFWCTCSASPCPWPCQSPTQVRCSCFCGAPAACPPGIVCTHHVCFSRRVLGVLAVGWQEDVERFRAANKRLLRQKRHVARQRDNALRALQQYKGNQSTEQEPAKLVLQVGPT